MNNATIPDLLRDLESAQADLASEYRKCTAEQLRVPPAEGEWSCYEVAVHIPVTYRFWIIWAHRIRVLAQSLDLVDTTPVEKTVYDFQHPDPAGVELPELRRSLAELRQVTGELVDLLGWLRQDEYETQLPPISDERRAELAETPPGHTVTLSLPTHEQHETFTRFLDYAGGFSVKGAIGHTLEGHTRNHTRQFAAARDAAAAALTGRQT